MFNRDYDLSRLMAPRHVAVFGGGWAHEVIKQYKRSGYSGKLWPVHPNHKKIEGYPVFATLDALPEPPDLVYLAVNRHTSLTLVRQLSQMGAGGVICFASGFSETGADDLQAELIEAAGIMPVLGPNCYGFVNYLSGLTLWPDQHGGKPVENGAAILSQSSNIAINLTMQTRGLPLAFIGCLGNQAQIALEDWGGSLLDLPEITALGCYVEGIKSPQKMAMLAQKATSLNKRIIVLKSGHSVAGREAAASHTASLAGEGVVSSAFFKQAGMIEAESLSEFLELLKLAHFFGAGQIGMRLCSISCSGGEAGLMGDLFEKLGVNAPKPSLEVKSTLQERLGPLVTINNPFDYHTFIWGNIDEMHKTFTTFVSDYDAAIYVGDFPRLDRCNRIDYMPLIDALAKTANDSNKPIFLLSSLAETLDEPLIETCLKQKILPLGDMATGVKVIQSFVNAVLPAIWQPLTNTKATDTPMMVNEFEAKQQMAKRGITIPNAISAPTLNVLKKKIDHIKPPFAVKALGLAHKSDVGGVWLNCHNLDAINPIKGATGYLAESMVDDYAVELLVGLRREPPFGIALTLGYGGVMTEIFNDTQTLVLPVSDEAIKKALQCLNIAPLLLGYRGKPPVAIDDLIENIRLLCDWIINDPNLMELEVNPFMVTPTAAIAVDALMKITKEET